MANPPFNVDEVDAEKVRKDPRLPFGLPGVNKGKQGQQTATTCGSPTFTATCPMRGRAGFVMSSQASSAGAR
jgi:type I restriction enzyme M protein